MQLLLWLRGLTTNLARAGKQRSLRSWLTGNSTTCSSQTMPLDPSLTASGSLPVSPLVVAPEQSDATAARDHDSSQPVPAQLDSIFPEEATSACERNKLWLPAPEAVLSGPKSSVSNGAAPLMPSRGKRPGSGTSTQSAAYHALLPYHAASDAYRYM